jgi:hypothetical protein
MCTVLLLAGFGLGCASPGLHTARQAYYQGNLTKADQELVQNEVEEKDIVLWDMEYGMVLQNQARYEASAKVFIQGAEELDRLETYSVSKGAASLVVNDNVQPFRGTPFERTFLHIFTAFNHLALGHWDNAAVEARRLIQSLDPAKRGEYPEDAFSRYMAGFCLEMIGDDSNASLQYRLADKLSGPIEINENTGELRIRPMPAVSTNQNDEIRESDAPKVDPWPQERPAQELVCFVLLGRSPTGSEVWNGQWHTDDAPFAEIYADGKRLGRSYNLADTDDLAYETMQRLAAIKAAKTVGRVVIKEGLAQAVESATDNEAMGDLVRIILIGLLEQPDLRRWETLPRWLQVARVPCPENLDDGFKVVVKSATGVTQRSMHVRYPLQERYNIFVNFCRDFPEIRQVPPQPGPPDEPPIAINNAQDGSGERVPAAGGDGAGSDENGADEAAPSSSN